MRNSASEMFVQCNILLPFDELLRKSIFAFRTIIQSSNNTSIQCMVNSVACVNCVEVVVSHTVHMHVLLLCECVKCLY